MQCNIIWGWGEMVGLGIQLSTFDIILTFIREQGVGVWQGL